jgi:hypothetical protein
VFLEKGLESAIRSTQAMFAQNIDLLHNLTEKEINGLSASVPTIQMTLNPGKTTNFIHRKKTERIFVLFRTYITRFMYVCEMFFEYICCT